MNCTRKYINLWKCLQNVCKRKYSKNERLKRSIMLQNTDEMPVYEYPRSKQNDRRVYVWGLAETGALGVHQKIKQHSQKNAAFVQHPTRTKFAEFVNVIDITCGYGFSAFVIKTKVPTAEVATSTTESTPKNPDNYTLFGTGLNTDGQIGYHKHGGHLNRPLDLLIYPVPIQLPKSVKNPKEHIQIMTCSAGRAHLLALSDQGVVFTLGNNAYGQCGRKIVTDEDYFNRPMIHRIEQLNNEPITSVCCGQDHSLFLTQSGKLYACGWSADGQTGQGHYNTIDVPTQIYGDISKERITKVTGTADCVLALNDSGEVFGWGNSEYGQLKTYGDTQQINLPQFLECTRGLGRIIDIAAGGSNCMVLNENGDVFIWGYGILGFGPTVEYSLVPKQIPATLFGRNEFNPKSHVTSIYSGISHMGAITNDSDLYMWGKNRHGCLGLGHVKDQFFPFKVSIGAKVLKIGCGVDHTMAFCKGFM